MSQHPYIIIINYQCFFFNTKNLNFDHFSRGGIVWTLEREDFGTVHALKDITWHFVVQSMFLEKWICGQCVIKCWHYHISSLSHFRLNDDNYPIRHHPLRSLRLASTPPRSGTDHRSPCPSRLPYTSGWVCGNVTGLPTGSACTRMKLSL